MPDYDNNMRGVLFRNHEKSLDTHPDYKGNAEVNGQEFWLSSWLKTSQKGQRYMSLAFTPKDGGERGGGGGGSVSGDVAAPITPEDTEDIPF